MRPDKRLRLFLNLLWREVEPRSCGIPAPYRITGRIDWRTAWEVAGIVHPGEGHGWA